MAGRRFFQCIGLVGFLIISGCIAATENDQLDNVSVTADSISISPGTSNVEVVLGQPQDISFRVTGHFPSGTKDLTSEAELTLSDGRLGAFSGGVLQTSGELGGKATIVAKVGKLETKADVTIKLTVTKTTGDVPAQSTDLFAGANQIPGPAPAWSYPQDNVLLPPNLSRLSLMWIDEDNDLWQVKIATPLLEFTFYTSEPLVELPFEVYAAVANTHRESQIETTVKGMQRNNPSGWVVSEKLTLRFARDELNGGLYYWANSDNGGIIRYDFAKADAKPEKYYASTSDGTEPGHEGCVGCHTLSRDGTKMAVSFGGGDTVGIMDVATRKLVTGTGPPGTFKTFTPDNKWLIATNNGTLSLIDTATGNQASQFQTDGKAVMPDVSPDGKWLVYVQPINFISDMGFTGGQLMIAPLIGTTLGKATLLVESDGTYNNYYPSFSPDGKWVLFNRSSATHDDQMDSYSDDPAQLWVVSAAGGTAIALDKSNKAKNMRNSWGRWAPYRHNYKGGKLLWLTFSSIRNYGTILNNTGAPEDPEEPLPQLWMAGFDPEKAHAGEDPSTPAFWLPFQDMQTNNHIAQWVEKIVNVH
jgi:hypothetical protein